MYMISVDKSNGRLEIAVEGKDLLNLANILEDSRNVVSFHVTGMYLDNQQIAVAAGGFTKWISPKYPG